METVHINVPLTIAEAEQLIALAKRQRRKPREQAAYMLVSALSRKKLTDAARASQTPTQEVTNNEQN